MGRPASPVELIEELSRFLPPPSVTTDRLGGVGAPDFADQMTLPALVAVLLRVLENDATGVLFAEGPREPGRTAHWDRASVNESGRKELYFLQGRLHHVASNNASELLGQYLVRHGTISPEELDFSLAVLPRYGGRMGETLVSLGLVSSLDVFRAIRDQGRDRIVGLFRWTTGKLAFFADQTSPHVEFPLDFELIPLIFSGVEAAEPDETPMAKWKPHLDVEIGPATTRRPALERARWPEIARRLLALTRDPKPVREILHSLARAEPKATANDALRALDIMLAGQLLTRIPLRG
jgi:serine/threonine-protein kinase